MSKKHFHGRRHIRAQKTVAVSRAEKRAIKFNRDLAILSHFVRFRLPQLFGDVFHPLIDAMKDLRNSFLEVFEQKYEIQLSEGESIRDVIDAKPSHIYFVKDEEQ
jgi:hypothetical protein